MMNKVYDGRRGNAAFFDVMAMPTLLVSIQYPAEN
jgi:hypothetical protein